MLIFLEFISNVVDIGNTIPLFPLSCQHAGHISFAAPVEMLHRNSWPQLNLNLVLFSLSFGLVAIRYNQPQERGRYCRCSE